MSELTEAQLELLRQMPDDKFIFPTGRQSRSFEKLERLGYAESDLRLAARDNRTGITDFCNAYKRTAKGKAKVEEVRPCT